MRGWALLMMSLQLCILCSGLYACGGGVIKRVDEEASLPPPPVKRGYLDLPSGPSQTRIYLNDRYIGRYSDYPRNIILVPIGKHRLRLVAAGYATIYAEIKIKRDHPTRLTRPLIPLIK